MASEGDAKSYLQLILLTAFWICILLGGELCVTEKYLPGVVLIVVGLVAGVVGYKWQRLRRVLLPWAKPELDIVWKSGEPVYHYEYDLPPGHKNVQYRLCVVNNTDVALSHVQVTLANLAPLVLNCVPCPLKLMHDNTAPYSTSFTLPQRGERFVDLLLQHPGGTEFWLFHTVTNVTNWEIPAQFYSLTIKAESDDAETTVRHFELEQNGPLWELRDKGLAEHHALSRSRLALGAAIFLLVAGALPRPAYRYFHHDTNKGASTTAIVSVPAPSQLPDVSSSSSKARAKTKPEEAVKQSKPEPKPTEEQDGREQLKIDDTVAAKVTRNPAIQVAVNRIHTVKVTDEIGAPLQGAQVLFIRQNGTHSNVVVSNALGVAEVLAPDEAVTVFCAKDGFAAYYRREYDPTTSLMMSLKQKPDGGSIIFDSGTGYVPGLTGRLNPILDTANRTYVYAENIAIDGGQNQPVTFALHRPLMLEDMYGHKFEIEFVALVRDSFLVNYRKVE